MILDWISKLGFVAKDPNSSVYLEFPAATRKILAAQTAGFLLKDTTDQNILSSPNHVYNVLEILGQGFSLPLEDAETIESVTELYKRWLLSNKRPSPIDTDEQPFLQRIFMHFSLIFEPRQNQNDSQVLLCNRVLSIIEQATREIGGRFSQETWELLLKVMLGCADVLLRDPLDDPSQLSSKLCPQLLKVLFQVWFRSKNMNNSLWLSLAQLLRGWRHRMPTIVQYNAICVAFTARVIRLLYGPNEGSDSVLVAEYDGTRTPHELEKEYVYYAWYRTLHLLGDFETISLPNNYLEAMRGINAIADMLLAVGARREPTGPKPPDGNTILHIVGPFLFEGINIYDQPPSFDRGKAQAFVALSKIFAAKGGTTMFDPKYLSYFYRGIEQGLKKNNYMMAVIINNSLNLFQTEFKGVRVLIPAFLTAMDQILTSGKPLEGISSKIQVLRASCIKILGSFISLPYHFGNLKFKEDVAQVPDASRVPSYVELRLKLGNLLLEGFRTEEDSVNRQTILWTMVLFFYENIEFPEVKELPHLFITILLGKIIGNAWPLDDMIQGLLVLSELSMLQSHVQEYNKGTAHYLVTSLCKLIDTMMEEKKGTPPPNENLVIRIYYTILDWVMSDTKYQWILSNKACLKAVLEVVEIGITGQKHIPEPKQEVAVATMKRRVSLMPKTEEKKEQSPPAVRRNFVQPSEKIKEAAHCVLVNLLYHVDNFPSRLGPSRLSSSLTEKELMEAKGLTANHILCFALDHTLISVIRHPKEAGKPYRVTVILRDETGKYAWDSEINYNSKPYVLPQNEDKLLTE
eukprot:TRINITY_DN1007_c0_g1_i5.p1 TRINITY_DN1007_c0_g1~~TRINITY_DN1007_c0_g1_i5.p1  ORF type:complete len:802 (-),score=236.83 TRINITY_DN1007_c0_g1_i5:97-2502(-)